MKYRVQVPAVKGVKHEIVLADSVKFWDGGVLAFYDRDANMSVLYRAYAPGRWFRVDAEESE